MNTSSVRDENVAFRSRIRRAVGVSVVAHVALVLWLGLQQRTGHAADDLIEITWADPALVPMSPPPLAVTPEPEPEVVPVEPTPVVSHPETHFEREELQADVAPSIESVEAIGDRMESRLRAIQTSGSIQRAGLNVRVPEASARRAHLASGPSGTVATGQPIDLSRGGDGPERAIALRRGDATSPGPAMTMAKISGAPTEVSRPMLASMTGDPGDSTVVHPFAGVSLSGQVADRRLAAYSLPTYPNWAKREGVEASVSLQFRVLPDGRIKDNILVDRTSGYPDFDRNATDALLTWRFEPLSGTGGLEQWGAITFNYRLGDIMGH